MAVAPLLDAFHHTQAVAATSWVITHGLGTSTPCVDAYVGGVKIMPLSVVATSASVVTLTFAAAQSGSAVVV